MKIFSRVSILVLVIAFVVGLGVIVKAATTVNLGTADSFSVLAGSSIVDTNVSNIISGDVGLSPGTDFGVLTTGEVAGTIYAVDATGPDGATGNNPALVNGAKIDRTTAFNSITGQPTTAVISADLGGQTLAPGVYDDNDAPDSLSITGVLTLDGQGDPNAVFVFKTGSTLTTAAGSEVSLINGAQACNVFWQIGSSATLGTNSIFKGTILADIAITDNGGSTIEGRLLAGTGAVTLDNTTITKAVCVAPPSHGGSSRPQLPTVQPLINVTKIPSPLNLPSGPGSVTYTYKVTNIGEVAMTDISVDDNKCGPANFIDGDDNKDSILDLDEEWVYKCTKTVDETETNTVTACGSARNIDSSGSVCDTANATVVVGKEIVPPLIHVVKKPNVFILPVGGGPVTYTYTVTNPGTAPLSNVSIIDDKCTGLPGRVIGHPGDINKNNLLESNESWSFTCQTNIKQTTTNIGTAEGSANGLTAIDFSPATVAVFTPGLPNTGLSTDWIIGLLSGFLISTLIVLAYVLRKRLM